MHDHRQGGKLRELKDLLEKRHEANHTETIIKLLQDIDPNEKSTCSPWETALTLLARHGEQELVVALLDREDTKIDVDAPNNAGVTALMVAASHGHVDIVRLLLQKKAKVNTARPIDGVTALTLAANSGHAGIVKLLIHNRAAVHAAQHDGSTALMLAAWYGHVEVAQLLLTRLLLTREEALVNTVRQQDGMTALTLAAGRGQVKLVEILLEHGAAMDVVDKDGMTALSWACFYGQTGTAKLLLHRNKTLVNKARNDGLTPLMLAAWNGHMQTAALLLKSGAAVHAARSSDKLTALMVTSLNGQAHIAKLLLKRKEVQVNATQQDGMTPLMLAAWKGHVNMVALLLEHGAAVDMAESNNKKWTALMWATCYGHIDIIKLLLQKGAQAHVRDAQGRTAQMLAVEYKKMNAVLLLQPHMGETATTDTLEGAPILWIFSGSAVLASVLVFLCKLTVLGAMGITTIIVSAVIICALLLRHIFYRDKPANILGSAAAHYPKESADLSRAVCAKFDKKEEATPLVTQEHASVAVLHSVEVSP